MTLADTLLLWLGNFWLYGLLFFIVLTAVIFVHEAGHYLVARWFGVTSEIFSFGFGREIFGRTDKNGTRWSMRLYPFGGYVRFHGETDTIPASPTTYFDKPVWKRSLITAAGPAANFLFSILLLSVVYMTMGRPAPEPVVAAVEVGTPAFAQGMKIGDRIASVDGTTIEAVDQVRKMVAGKTGQDVTVVLDRAGEQITLVMKPKKLEEKNSYGFKTERGYLGSIWPGYGLGIESIHRIEDVDTRGNTELVRKLLKEKSGKELRINFGKPKAVDMIVLPLESFNPDLWSGEGKDKNILILGKRPNDQLKPVSPVAAVGHAFGMVWKGINAALGTVVQIIAGTKKADDLGGVIRISSSTGEMAQQGGYTFLSFVALLSVSIGLMNLLPIPMLDGGHLMFQAIEAVKGSPVSLRTKGYIYGFGLVFLLIAVFVINLNDLLRLLKG